MFSFWLLPIVAFAGLAYQTVPVSQEVIGTSSYTDQFEAPTTTYEVRNINGKLKKIAANPLENQVTHKNDLRGSSASASAEGTTERCQ